MVKSFTEGGKNKGPIRNFQAVSGGADVLHLSIQTNQEQPSCIGLELYRSREVSVLLPHPALFVETFSAK